MPIFSAIPSPRQVLAATRRMVVPTTRPTTRDRVPGNVESVIVVGAGLSGLAAACRLQAAGKQVTLVEANPEVGGRCRTEQLRSDHGEFYADTGATVLTMPDLVDNLLLHLGVDAEEVGWAYRKLRPAYHAMFASGRELDVYPDGDTMEHEVRRFAAGKYGADNTDIDRLARGYRQHRQWIGRIFDASFESFIGADFDSALDAVATPATANDMADLVELGAFGSLGKRAFRHLGDEELARVFSFQALYAGVAPAKARAVYGVISHMDTTMGVFYPRFGMGDVPEALARAFRLAGGELRCSTRVDRIVHDGARATGIRTADGEQVAADAVIVTADLPVVEELLGSPARLAGRKPNWSPSAVVVHGSIPVDVTAAWPVAGTGGYHHTISFGEAWDETFAELTAPRGRAGLMSDPSLLVTRPAATIPERLIRTEDGRTVEPVSVLAPAPNLDRAGVDWEAIAENYVQELLGVLEGRGFTGLQEHLSVARIDTPRFWQQQGHGAGSPFGLAHTVAQTGPFRPRNYPVAGLENVVLAGSSTTPGVGVPTTLLSGSLAARRIIGGGSIR
ncbi:phytoene desaturase family protein [Corynebacterium urealyticum]|uniref:phytoene desaturase family protein n=1 Tax=Corynebacterium urealyticum TaxID=43771 RepID=UPI0002B3FB44|nr:phytoene desaturase family protein [Corynebacterium urealyticum]AGE36793.1 phytoene dehydrogenase [Corynebacterium urealyticum DSM 7111]QQB08414.1 phytoene desaturase [Corynebacterium urealyticum]